MADDLTGAHVLAALRATADHGTYLDDRSTPGRFDMVVVDGDLNLDLLAESLRESAQEAGRSVGFREGVEAAAAYLEKYHHTYEAASVRRNCLPNSERK